MTRILPIIEGDGDFAAVPELIRRVAHQYGRFDVQVCRPHKRGDLPKVLGRFEDFFKTALLERCPILWVLDYDCAECTDQARHVAELRARGAALANGIAFEFVFLVQEFETLFLADHDSSIASTPTPSLVPTSIYVFTSVCAPCPTVSRSH